MSFAICAKEEAQWVLYVDDFSKLARYAPDDVATDAAKQETFLAGLNDELSMQLMVATFNNYRELVDRALMIERKQEQIDNRKRKYGQGKYNSGAQQRPHFTLNSGGHIHHNHGGHNSNGGSSHNHSGPKNGNGNGGSNGMKPFQPSNARQEGSKSHYLFQVREEWTLRHRVF